MRSMDLRPSGTKANHRKFRRRGIKRNPAKKRIIFIGFITAITILLASVSLVIFGDSGESDAVEYTGTIQSPSIECVNIGKNILERNGTAADAVLAAHFCESTVNAKRVRDGLLVVTVNNKETSNLDKYVAQRSFIGDQSTMLQLNLLQQMYGKLEWKDVVEPAVKLCELEMRKNILVNSVIPTQEEACLRLKDIAKEAPTNNPRLQFAPLNRTKISNQTFFTISSMEIEGVLSLILKLTERLMTADHGLLIHRLIETLKYAHGILNVLDDNISLQKNRHILDEYANEVYSNIKDDKIFNNYSYDGEIFSVHNYHELVSIAAVDGNGQVFSLTKTINTLPRQQLPSFKPELEQFGQSQSHYESERIPHASNILQERTFTTMENPRIPIILVDNSTLVIGYTDKKSVPISLIQIQSHPLPFITGLGTGFGGIMASPLLSQLLGAVFTYSVAATTGVLVSEAMYCMEDLSIVLVRYSLLEESLVEAIRAPRLHYDFKAMRIEYEPGYNQSILDYLKLKGHVMKPASSGTDFGTVTAIINNRNGAIETIADPRISKR